VPVGDAVVVGISMVGICLGGDVPIGSSAGPVGGDGVVGVGGEVFSK